MPEEGGDQAKYYEYRIKEYGERYESMRTLEWQTLLQTYAGYGAIAVAYQKAVERCQSAWLFQCLAMLATLVFAFAMQYLHYRIQERAAHHVPRRLRVLSEKDVRKSRR